MYVQSDNVCLVILVSYEYVSFILFIWESYLVIIILQYLYSVFQDSLTNAVQSVISLYVHTVHIA